MRIIADLLSKGIKKGLYENRRFLFGTTLGRRGLAAGAYYGAGTLGTAYLDKLQEQTSSYEGRFGQDKVEALSSIRSIPQMAGMLAGGAALFGMDPINSIRKIPGDIAHVFKDRLTRTTLTPSQVTRAGIAAPSNVVGKYSPLLRKADRKKLYQYYSERTSRLGDIVKNRTEPERGKRGWYDKQVKAYQRGRKIVSQLGGDLGTRPGSAFRMASIGAGLGALGSLYYQDEIFGAVSSVDHNISPWIGGTAGFIGGMIAGGRTGGIFEKYRAVGSSIGWMAGAAGGAYLGSQIESAPLSLGIGLAGSVAAGALPFAGTLSSNAAFRSLTNSAGAFAGAGLGAVSSAFLGASALANPEASLAGIGLVGSAAAVGALGKLTKVGYQHFHESINLSAIGTTAGAAIGVGMVGAMRMTPGASEGRITQVYGNNQSPIQRLNYSTAGLPLSMHRNRRSQ